MINKRLDSEWVMDDIRITLQKQEYNPKSFLYITQLFGRIIFEWANVGLGELIIVNCPGSFRAACPMYLYKVL